MKSHSGWTAFIAAGALAFIGSSAAAAAQGQNLLVNGDFEKGNTGFTSGYTFGDVSIPGNYTVGANPSTVLGGLGDWCNCGDHTTGRGMMMIVDGGNSASIPVWEETVAITPSTTYTFSYWGAEVDHDSSSLPHLSLAINGKAVGDSTFPEYSPDNGGSWKNYKFTWNSAADKSAHLALFDLNTDAPWNDFAIDDLSFSASAGDAGSAPASARSGSSSGAITTIAQVIIKNEQGAVIPLKPAEKIAFMFMSAISSMEGDCQLHLNRACSLAELVAGPKSPGWNIGKLKYDPQRDPNYRYAVTTAGRGWTASANAQHPGLGGFFCVGKSMIPDCYYNPNGPASASGIKLGETSIAGEIFNVP